MHTCLGHRCWPSLAALSGTGKQAGGRNEGGTASLADPREYQQSDQGWYQAEGVEVIWNLECPVGLNQKEKCAQFNEGNWVQFGWSTERDLWEPITDQLCKIVAQPLH